MTQPRPWYAAGVDFTCTQCGHCCTTAGYVWVADHEAQRLAEHLELSLEEFGARYLRLVSGRKALTDRSDGACVFWDEGCTVYPARPDQCRTFPFWKENVVTREAWDDTAVECEGIGEGKHYSKSEIVELVRGKGATAAAARREV